MLIRPVSFGTAGSGNVTVSTGITASTTQTQGQQPLTATWNEVATVANTNDVVTLPTASSTTSCLIRNNGMNTLQIFPASGDAIDDKAANASIALPPTAICILHALDAVTWYSTFQTKIKIPSRTGEDAFLVDAGDFGIDTLNVGWDAGILMYYDGEIMGCVAMPASEFVSPSLGDVPQYDDVAQEFVMGHVPFNKNTDSFSSNQTLSTSHFAVEVDSSSAQVTITLPDVGTHNCREYYITKTNEPTTTSNDNYVIVTTSGADTIGDTDDIYLFHKDAFIHVKSDGGSNWIILSEG